MDTTTGAASTGAVPGRGPVRRRWWLFLAVALVAVAGADFVWWGNPRMGPGGVTGVGEGMSWANDGVTDTRMLVRGRHAAVSATFSILNEGRLPFTVRGLEVETDGWLSGQRVTFVPGIPGFGEPAAAVDQVTLAPGEEATVQWSLTTTCQPLMAEGSFMSIDALRFRVSWLGFATVRELALDRPITFLGDPRIAGVPEC